MVDGSAGRVAVRDRHRSASGEHEGPYPRGVTSRPAESPPPKPPVPDRVLGSRRRVLRAILIVVAAIAVLLVGGALWVKHELGDMSCPSPPTDQDEARHQAFVEAHVPDANGFDWTVADCDDRGQASLGFTTKLSPAAAAAAFLSDPACTSSTDADADPFDLSCEISGTGAVVIYFSERAGKNGLTAAELYLPLPGDR